MSSVKPDEKRAQYAKPGMALHYLYQEVVDKLRTQGASSVMIEESGSLKDIAKKIVMPLTPQ